MLLTEKFQPLLESSKYAPLNESEKNVMSVLLENTEQEQKRLLAESTTSGDIAQFTPIMMPLVRRVYPTLIANELLGVQPMTTPTGFIYALIHRYTGNNIDASKVAPVDAAQILIVDDASTIEVNHDIKSASNVEGTVIHKEGNKVLVKLKDPKKKFTAEGLQNPASKNITAVYSNEASFQQILKKYTGPYTTAVGEKLANDINEVGFSVEKKAVEVKTRKLKAQYTLEMYEDLKNQHGILADEELISLMSAELQNEIDREVVTFVNTNATQLPDLAFKPHDADGRWEIEKYRIEAIKIAQEARNIGLLTKRGQGNILLVSPKVATMLEQVGTFKFADSVANINGAIFSGNVGTFDNKYKVIVDQYATSDYITTLYKGSDRRDAMGFFSPYVPVSLQKLVDQTSGQPALLLRTRYGLDTTPLNPEYYARSWAVDLSNTALAKS